jgi:hypothetical protein
VQLIRQSDNNARDIVAGNKSETTFNIINAASVDELSVLYAKLKQNGVGDISDGSFCEQLEHYLANLSSG